MSLFFVNDSKGERVAKIMTNQHEILQKNHRACHWTTIEEAGSSTRASEYHAKINSPGKFGNLNISCLLPTCFFFFATILYTRFSLRAWYSCTSKGRKTSWNPCKKAATCMTPGSSGHSWWYHLKNSSVKNCATMRDCITTRPRCSMHEARST